MINPQTDVKSPAGNIKNNLQYHRKIPITLKDNGKNYSDTGNP